MSAGNADQSGFRSRIAAIVSESVSPANARCRDEHLVQDTAKRPDIRPLVDRLPSRLFRAHVTGGPENPPRLRRLECRRRRVRQVDAGSIPGDHFRNAEVEELEHPVVRDRDIGRLEVAVRDALLVRRFERVGDLTSVAKDLLEREAEPACSAGSLQPLGKRLAVDELEHQSPNAVALFDPVDRRDVRMVERCDDARFTLETREPALRRP